MRILCLALCLITGGMPVLAEEPAASPPAPPPWFLIPAIEDRFEADVSKVAARIIKAEADLAKVRQTSGTVRLKAYKKRFADLTKAGMTEEAAEVKGRIDRLEQDPEADAPAAGTSFLLPMIEEKFAADVASSAAKVIQAEAEVIKARQNAGAARLKAYKTRLEELTKTANTEQVAAVKGRIDRLEKAPEQDATIPRDELPPGAAVYDLFPDEERPYLIKDYLLNLNSQSETIDFFTKKLANAKGRAATDTQIKLDLAKKRFEHLKATNEPPLIMQKISNWGQKVRSGPAQGIEWKVGAVGMASANVKIEKILSKDEAVVTRIYEKNNQTQTIILQGIDTSMWDPKRVQGVFIDKAWVSGTGIYVTDNGVSKEAPIVETFDWDRYKDERAELFKK